VSRETLKKKTNEIMDRAGQIKEFLDQSKNNEQGGGAGGAATKTAKKDKAKEEEEDKARMRSGLEGAIVKIKPNVRWDEIAGLEGAKEALREAVIMPTRFPQLFVGRRRPWKGILMYGPPGTGKSHLAKAVATESDGTFFSVSSSDLMSRWLGDSEKLVRNLFELARESHREEKKPSIIFIDEIDSLCGARSEGENDATRRIKTEFLVQMQGVGHDDTGVLVLAATNIPWSLDSAIRRRFERRVYIPLPDEAARFHMFKLNVGDTPHNITDEQFHDLARRTVGYSGGDITILVNNALMEPVRAMQLATHFKRAHGPDPDNAEVMCDTRLVPCSPGDPLGVPMTLNDITEPKLVMTLPVTYMDTLKALRTTKPSVSEDDVSEHIKFTENFGQEG
jgi:vacuolar protein-sorting-associated protein 4